MVGVVLVSFGLPCCSTAALAASSVSKQPIIWSGDQHSPGRLRDSVKFDPVPVILNSAAGVVVRWTLPSTVVDQFNEVEVSGAVSSVMVSFGFALFS